MHLYSGGFRGPNNRFVPSLKLELASPLGNPGSATTLESFFWLKKKQKRSQGMGGQGGSPLLLSPVNYVKKKMTTGGGQIVSTILGFP